MPEEDPCFGPWTVKTTKTTEGQKPLITYKHNSGHVITFERTSSGLQRAMTSIQAMGEVLKLVDIPGMTDADGMSLLRAFQATGVPTGVGRAAPKVIASIERIMARPPCTTSEIIRCLEDEAPDPGEWQEAVREAVVEVYQQRLEGYCAKAADCQLVVDTLTPEQPPGSSA